MSDHSTLYCLFVCLLWNLDKEFNFRELLLLDPFMKLLCLNIKGKEMQVHVCAQTGGILISHVAE